ncbi:MAG: hypothetical protein ACYDHH_23960 [Solirubrobacteraceae bacterium]
MRTDSGLEELVYEERGSVPSECPWRVERVCVTRPLSPLSRPGVSAAWASLGAVSEWDGRTAARVLMVLRETVSAVDVEPALPPLTGAVRRVAVRRSTAAHPRAYRGTRYQPPSPRQPVAVDVRPYLRDGRHVVALLVLLGEQPGGDPYLRSRFGVRDRPLDHWFVRSLLPLFDRCSWPQVTAFQAIARALDLCNDARLRAAMIGVFLSADGPERALGWWGYVLGQTPTARVEVAQIVAGSGVAVVDAVGTDVASEIAALDVWQQWSFLRGLARGASVSYLTSGVALGAFPNAKVIEPPAGTGEVTGAISEVIERLGAAADEDSGPEFWRAHLWQLCGEQPGLLELLRSPAFTNLVPRAAFWLVRVAATPHWERASQQRRWAELERWAHEVCATAAGLPGEYQRAFIEDWADVYWFAVDRPGDLAGVLGEGIALCLRVARAPFLTEPVLGPALARLAAAAWKDSTSLDRLRAAPDASWVALERACRRENDAWLIGWGLARIARPAPELLIATFPRFPGALQRTANALAGVSSALAEQIVAADAASPLATLDIAAAPIERLVELIDPIARAGAPNPIRRALREHLDGRVQLSDQQLTAHRARLVAELDLVRLAVIRQAVERHQAALVGLERIETSAERHAVEMLDFADTNRRQLRRLITSVVDGDPSWRIRHPLTQAWLARHPQIAIETWLNGIRLCRDVARIGTVWLAIETDPFEALKLGTYAGSCLGRGGGLSYSAAAVVLDINKSVVYARDEHGTVIGRQLIALSEAHELVCFNVYTSNPTQLQPLFRDFDLALATELRIPLFDPATATADYDIATILSHEWWDDGAWNPPDPAPATTPESR